jgi:RecA-family ATPase
MEGIIVGFKTAMELPTIKPPKSPGFRLMSEVTPKAVRWLWPRRIPLGELTLIDGDPGTNKSSLLLDIAARVSNGSSMPYEIEGEQGNVLLLIGEDRVTKTVRLRLQTAGANMDRIAVMDKIISIPDNLDAIEEAAVQVSARLLVIDPLSVFLNRSTASEQTVRQALTPLQRFAERTNVAVVMIRHLNKSGGRQALYRGLGSIGISAATRSAFLAANDPRDPNMRVLCHIKNTLGPLTPSLLFEPVATEDSMRIEWRGECEYTGKDLLAATGKDQTKRDQAREFLVEALASGPVEQAIIQQRAAEMAIAYRTIERAKQLLGIVSRREGFGPGSIVYWELPTAEASASDAAP